MRIGMIAFFVAAFGGTLGIYADLNDHLILGKVGFVIVAVAVLVGWVIVLFGIVVNFWGMVNGGFESLGWIRQRGLRAAYHEAKRRYEGEYDSKPPIANDASSTQNSQNKDQN